jgi:hypothetical protein
MRATGEVFIHRQRAFRDVDDNTFRGKRLDFAHSAFANGGGVARLAGKEDVDLLLRSGKRLRIPVLQDFRLYAQRDGPQFFHPVTIAPDRTKARRRNAGMQGAHERSPMIRWQLPFEIQCRLIEQINR